MAKITQEQIDAVKAPQNAPDATIAAHVSLPFKKRIDLAVANRQIAKGDWVIEALLEKLQREEH